MFTWASAFLPAAGGTELTLRVADRGGARWERAIDAIGTQRVLTEQYGARLARIAAAVDGLADFGVAKSGLGSRKNSEREHVRVEEAEGQ